MSPPTPSASPSPSERTGPLSDLLVVALEQAVAAPLCTLRLADAGARVIKIERAEGDFAREYDAVADAYAALLPQYGVRRLIAMLTEACAKGIESVPNAPPELEAFIAARSARSASPLRSSATDSLPRLSQTK